LALEPLSISNPTLGFRLDPGEPGMLRAGKATEATLLVTAQEHRNLARLKSEAMREGRVIIHAGIQFGRAFKGAFLTTTNGLTTVISREPRPTVFESEAARLAAAGPRDPLPPADEAASAEDQAGPPALDPAAGRARRVLADEENRLRAELRGLETPGLAEPVAPPEADDQPAVDPLMALEEAAARRDQGRRLRRAREVEGDLRRVTFRRLMSELGAAGMAAGAPAATA
jgi:hypothetical protein